MPDTGGTGYTPIGSAIEVNEIDRIYTINRIESLSSKLGMNTYKFEAGNFASC